MIKVGDKVKPINKSIGSRGLDGSVAWEDAQALNQDFLYVIRIDPDRIVCNVSPNETTGDWFKEIDLIKIEGEVKKVKQPRPKASEPVKPTYKHLQAENLEMIQEIERLKQANDLLLKENVHLEQQRNDQRNRKKRIIEQRDKLEDANDGLGKMILEHQSKFNDLQDRYQKLLKHQYEREQETSRVIEENETMKETLLHVEELSDQRLKQNLILQRRVETLMKVIDKLV